MKKKTICCEKVFDLIKIGVQKPLIILVVLKESAIKKHATI